jgi:ubiquinone/menaquinone biosynthesis C-methylase UbiE
MLLNKIFICPDCHKQLKKKLFIHVFTCPNCGFKCKRENGLYYLHSNDNSWEKCETEKNAWISVHKELGIYLDNQDHFCLPDGKPHLKEFYAEAKKSIDKMLELEDFSNKLCLDLGAGIGWVDCYILQHTKPRIIALECSDDKFVGLGRAMALKKYHKCDFLSIVGDMHNVPIADGSIDIVFMVDALHHFSDLRKVLLESHRVLKPKSHFWAINEPYRPENIADEFEFVRQNIPLETKHNITERRPTISEYLRAGDILNLQVLNEKLGFIASGLILYGEK